VRVIIKGERNTGKRNPILTQTFLSFPFFSPTTFHKPLFSLFQAIIIFFYLSLTLLLFLFVLFFDRLKGKTCLFHRLQGRGFREEYLPTNSIQTCHIHWSYKGKAAITAITQSSYAIINSIHTLQKRKRRRRQFNGDHTRMNMNACTKRIVCCFFFSF